MGLMVALWICLAYVSIGTVILRDIRVKAAFLIAATVLGSVLTGEIAAGKTQNGLGWLTWTRLQAIFVIIFMLTALAGVLYRRKS